MTDRRRRLGDGRPTPREQTAERRSPLPGRDPGGRAPPRERDRGELERDLLRLESEVEGLERPYLTSLPDTCAGEELLFEWLSHLHGEAGLKRALEAVAYYRDIGWINQEVETALREYLLGLDLGVEQPRELWADDHLDSLAYVARLTAMGEDERA